MEQRRPKPPGLKGRAQLQSELTHGSNKNYLPDFVSCGFFTERRKVPEIFQWHSAIVIDEKKVLKSEPVDLLFLDIQMLGGTGIEVMEQIRTARMPPIVFVAAHNVCCTGI